MLRRPLAVLLVALAGLIAAATQPAQAAKLRFGPVPHRDGRDVAISPLDVVGASFGQREARLTLRLRTRSSWNPGDLDGRVARDLCVELFYGSRTGPRARICVISRAGNAALLYLRLNDAGQVDEQRALPAAVSRPSRRVLEAGFTRVEAGLPRGRFRWRVVSRWTGGATCPLAAPCTDLAPNRGTFSERIGFVAGPRCFGAAARNPGHRCSNPALRRAVIPTPRVAARTPNAHCASDSRVGLVSACTFGVSTLLASTTVAIVGDSHAQHWRGALEVVAQAKRWHGVSITRAGCPLTHARPIIPGRVATRNCRLWIGQVEDWFRRHSEVTTLVVAAHAGARAAGNRQRGYRAAWNALPSSVRNIIVIHDAPSIGKQAGCIRRALALRRPPGLACAVPRRRGLRRDPHYAAARRSGSRRVHAIDMTRFFCDPRVCFPVIGGALVHKDGAHMTRVFAGTLGRFLLGRINRVT
ncbi:MAG: SGNH hydrolase domain-containing protein [Solirubrobacteraceae bacterium]